MNLESNKSYTKTNIFDGKKLVWNMAARGVRSVGQNPYFPMTGIEAEIFCDMEKMGKNFTKTESAIYEIRPI